MDAARIQLQAMYVSAQTWESRIKKTTYSDSVSFSCDPETSEFSITASWKNKAGEMRSYQKKFDAALVFGPRFQKGQRPVIQKRLCTLMQEFMSEVLHSRGV